MTFVLGKKSLSALDGVHPDLVKCVKYALSVSDLDFRVTEGLRTEKRQKELKDSGASKTMNSRHLTGHAIDIAPIVNGAIRWDWPLFYKLAEAMQLASQHYRVPIIWGGVWDLPMTEYGDPEDAMLAYAARRKAAGKKAFTDGPHFELCRKRYPA